MCGRQKMLGLSSHTLSISFSLYIVLPFLNSLKNLGIIKVLGAVRDKAAVMYCLCTAHDVRVLRVMHVP